jgi:hypothetical protein
VKQETTWDQERCQVVSLVWWLNLKCEKTCDWWESSSFKLPDVFQDRMSCASQVVACWSLCKRLIQPQVLATKPRPGRGLWFACSCRTTRTSTTVICCYGAALLLL